MGNNDGRNEDVVATKQTLASIAPILGNINSQYASVILKNETTRLQEKKAGIDYSVSTQDRLIDMTNSKRQRYVEYIKIVLVFIVALVIILICKYLTYWTPIFPEYVFTTVCILGIGGTAVYAYSNYSNVLNRDPIIYDKISVDSSSMRRAPPSTSTDGNLLGGINLVSCLGSSCCATGTIWDTGNSVCVVDSGESDTTTESMSTGTDSTISSGNVPSNVPSSNVPSSNVPSNVPNLNRSSFITLYPSNFVVKLPQRNQSDLQYEPSETTLYHKYN